VTVISACSLIVEPADMWLRRIERRFYHQAPRIAGEGASRTFTCPADASVRLALKDVAWADDPACSADPFVRVPALEQEGIEAELVFPTLTWSLLGLEDDLRLACLRTYNTWLANVMSSAPRRLFGVAMLPPGAAAGAELERVAAMGLKAAIAPIEGEQLPAELVSAAARTGAPLWLVPLNVSPFVDHARFDEEELRLTRAALDQGVKSPLIVIVPPRSLDAPNVRFITSDPSKAQAANALWGRTGSKRASPDAGPSAQARAAVTEFFRLGI
jgi:hypothetical protein